LNRGGKLNNLKREMQKSDVCSRRQWSTMEMKRWNKKLWLYSVFFRGWRDWKMRGNSGA
jgi:hypothetical protein